MTIDDAIAAWLKTQATLTAIVGQKVYAAPAPAEAVPPRVSYQLISDIPDRVLSGNVNRRVVRLQLDAWSADDDKATSGAIADVLEALLIDRAEYRPPIGGLVVGTVFKISDCSLLDRGQLYDDPAHEHRASCDFRVVYRAIT